MQGPGLDPSLSDRSKSELVELGQVAKDHVPREGSCYDDTDGLRAESTHHARQTGSELMTCPR